MTTTSRWSTAATVFLPALGVWAISAAALWVHALAGVPGRYLGQGYPVYPGLTVTRTSLAMDAALATVPILFLAALLSWRNWRRIALPIICLAWLWAGVALIFPFSIDFGTTWQWTELLGELVWRPMHTPVALAVVCGLSWLALGWHRASRQSARITADAR